MNHSLIPPSFLFRFVTSIHRFDGQRTGSGVELGDSYRLLHFGALDGDRQFADVRAAWDPAGLTFSVHVDGKRRALWCRESQLDESDGLQVWIDTRNTQSIHRATRFCHRFAFLPAGGGQNLARPIADQLLIPRARENARPVRPRELQVDSRIRKTGYSLIAFVPTIALEGYDPNEHRELGFQYAVLDRESGIQTFSAHSTMPHDEDPSLWATLHMVE